MKKKKEIRTENEEQVRQSQTKKSCRLYKKIEAKHEWWTRAAKLRERNEKLKVEFNEQLNY